MRRLAILAEGAFEWHYGKTATGVIRYGKDTVVAVIDSTRAGQDVAQALGHAIGKGIPVVRDINEALKYQPDALLIGIAPMGGALPVAWRWQLLTAIEAGLDIISGLHFFIAEDEELRSAAEKHGVTIWDVRRPPEQNRVAQFIPHRPGSYTILVVGSDCATGKMSTALEMDQEASSRGINSAFVATGQTGIMISGNGLPVDRIISDFVAGVGGGGGGGFFYKKQSGVVAGGGGAHHSGVSPGAPGVVHCFFSDALIFFFQCGGITNTEAI